MRDKHTTLCFGQRVSLAAGFVALLASVGCSGPGSADPVVSPDSTGAGVIEIETDSGVKLDWVRVDDPSDDSEALTVLAAQNSLSDTPVVPLNSIISITFEGMQPDSVSLNDRVINTDGSQRFGQEPEVVTLIKCECDGSYNFALPINPAASASSNSRDYEPGAVIRGFTLTAANDAATVSYAFALHTDAYDSTQLVGVE